MMKINVLGVAILALGLTACIANIADPQTLALGKQIAFERSKGNCLACHQIADGEQPGNLGQPLIGIATKFQDKQQLRNLVWDATQLNPETTMPPFGRNKILTEAELDSVVEYLWSL
jgi:L-cysteine S-thiosulfotransferase